MMRRMVVWDDGGGCRWEWWEMGWMESDGGIIRWWGGGRGIDDTAVLPSPIPVPITIPVMDGGSSTR